MLPIVIKVLLVIHVIVSLLIILLVLMQRPKNEGLGAAFGGGATDQLFGAQTTNVLQTITRWLGGMFFALTLLLSILYVKQGGGRSPVQDKLTAPTVNPPLLTPPPAAAADGTNPALPPGAVLTPGAANPAGTPGATSTPGAPNSATPGSVEGTPLLDGKEPVKLEMTPGKPGEAFSEPVSPGAPALPPAKAPESPAAPGAEKSPEKAAPPAENKPAEPAPKPAEPAK